MSYIPFQQAHLIENEKSVQNFNIAKTFIFAIKLIIILRFSTMFKYLQIVRKLY
jgi:hypothetical protein